MGILKVGEAEKQLIAEVEAFKAKYVDRLRFMEEGLELAQKQLPDEAKDEVKEISEKIAKAKELTSRLRLIIERICFSEDYSEEKFSVSWNEINIAGGQNYRSSYGKYTSHSEPVTEAQFVYAITSWEKEVSKSLILFKQIGGYLFNSFCSDMEVAIHKIVYEYVNPKKV